VTTADWQQLEQDLMANDPPTVRAAAATLATNDDDRARALLAGALARPPGPASIIAFALGAHGAKAVPLALAALDDPSRHVAASLVLARVGSVDAVARLRTLIDDPEPMVRVSAAVGLYKAGDRDGAFWSGWLTHEGNILVFAFLAAIAAAVPISDEARANIDAQAAEPTTPPDVRANCVWAIAAHDAARGTALAEGLDEAGRAVLASIVARRGGPLSPTWVVGGDPAADRTAETLGISGVS